MTHNVGSAAMPLATNGDYGTPFYGVTPGDMAVQFGLPSHVQGQSTEINGSGSTVGLISDYNVNLNYLSNYGNTFGFYMPTVQVIVDGKDPGVSGGPIFTYFEAEAIGAIAPSTVIDIYTADSDGTQPVWTFRSSELSATTSSTYFCTRTKAAKRC